MKLFKISEQAVKSLTVEQITVLSVLSATPRKDYTSSFYCYVDYIANKLNYSDRQVKTHISKLKDANVFTIERERVNGTKEYRNLYSFPELNNQFILVNHEILNMELEVEEIGLLIKLKSLVFGNGLHIYKNKEWMAKACGLGKIRFNRILTSLEAKGLVKYVTNDCELNNAIFTDCTKIIKPTIHTAELLKVHNDIINSHAKSLGIDIIDRNALDRMLQNGLDVTSYIIGIYSLNGFKDVTNVNKLVNSFVFKNTERVTPMYDVTL